MVVISDLINSFQRFYYNMEDALIIKQKELYAQNGLASLFVE